MACQREKESRIVSGVDGESLLIAGATQIRLLWLP